MFYLETIKKLYESIKNDPEISPEDKAKVKEHIKELSNILALY
jgi:hypothetical protein